MTGACDTKWDFNYGNWDAYWKIRFIMLCSKRFSSRKIGVPSIQKKYATDTKGLQEDDNNCEQNGAIQYHTRNCWTNSRKHTSAFAFCSISSVHIFHTENALTKTSPAHKTAVENGKIQGMPVAVIQLDKRNAANGHNRKRQNNQSLRNVAIIAAAMK